MQQERRDRKCGLTTDKDEKVAEELSQNVSSTTQRLREDQRIHSETKIPDHRIAHDDPGEDRKSQDKAAAGEVVRDIKVAVCGPTSCYGGAPAPPQHLIRREEHDQHVRRDAFCVQEYFVCEDRGERSVKGVLHQFCRLTRSK